VKTSTVQARFLLGPAGSGKTFRCLAEVRAALAAEPDGPPLILLAPKQATFQLERQLLEDGEISGFTRLHILSFDRLAKFVFEQLNVAPPKLLSAEGRLMVLRALLQRHADELKLFRGSARRAGFAQELGTLLAELQEHQFTPAELRAQAANEKLRRELRDKLHDLALLAEKYGDWLREHGLQDANNLLDFATSTLRDFSRLPAFRVSGLWLDGFAEMTPQELALLTAVMPFCNEATLAFCLETEPTPQESWLSIWSAIGKTFQRCRDQISNLPGCKVAVEVLKREAARNRYAPDSELATLEETWALQVSSPASSFHALSAISVTACANPEAEAIFAAREILKFVRDGGGKNRFRDCAVLVRQLDGYHKPLARVFRRYGIPFFLDRRESVAHHPLAELTRNALRTMAHDWKNDDWFAALKCGFTPVAETEIDRLENTALEFGWRGKKWREPLPDETCERLREIIFPPFGNFYSSFFKINFKPTGEQLAAALRVLWRELDVEATLERWTLEAEQSSIHSTVWEQMNSWLENLALAFPHQHMVLRDWLPVLEAGLGNLTVGVIPPSLDEVLVGAIDRARNPSLKFAVLLGVNESIFPAAPAAPAILTNADRDELEKQNVTFSAGVLDQISRERYLGYIACTRANEKLALTFSKQSADGKTLNPSPLIAQVRRIFPELAVGEFLLDTSWTEAQHANELVPMLVGAERQPAAWLVSESEYQGAKPEAGAQTLLKIPTLKLLSEKLAALREPVETENLSPEFAGRIYGPVLKTSVSRLEEFAQCPFKFFIKSGLRANERKVFELDARERGNFQHEVLKEFHEQLTREGKRWRDLTPLQARERINEIAAAQMALHRDGLFLDSAEMGFAARAMTTALQDFVEVIVGWMHSQYEFDPAAAELGFGGKNDSLPAWEIDLAGGQKLALNGRIDRVDFWRDPSSDIVLAVVTDYKSGGKKLEPLLMENGIQLQLLAYLGALKNWTVAFSGDALAGSLSSPLGRAAGEDARDGRSSKIIPVGAFYVSLRGKFEGGGSRAEILGDTEAKKMAYRHNGRFDAGWLRKFDRREVNKGDQFNFKLNKDGGLPSNSAEAISCKEFTRLLDEVEDILKMLGERIFSGVAAVAPYRKGTQAPCEYCDYRAACRLDEWTHEFRELRMKEKSST
jgi:ATP-dependent helicase/nuclease subunit B